MPWFRTHDGRIDGWRLLAALGLIYAVAMAVVAVVRADPDPQHGTSDFRDFWLTALHFRQSGELRSDLGVHNYLPFFPLFMLPWSFLPLPAAAAIFTLLSAGLMGVTVLMVEGLLNRRVGQQPRRATLAAIGLMLPFIHSTLTVGAVNIVVLFLVVTCWLLVERRREWTAGAALGLACLIKLLPLALLGFFLVRRRWRVPAGAAATIVVLGAGMPLASLGWNETVKQHERFYREAIGEHSAHATLHAEKPRKAKYNNQSVPVTLRRLFTRIDANAGQPEDRFEVTLVELPPSRIWIMYVGLIGGVLIASAAVTFRGGEWPGESLEARFRNRAGFGVWCCVMLLASPLVWTHYFVLAYWPLAVLADRAERTALDTLRPDRVAIGLLAFWLVADVLIAWPAARAVGVHMLAVALLWALLAERAARRT